MSFVNDLALRDISAVAKGFIACGLDLDMISTGSIILAESFLSTWVIKEDQVLVKYLNNWCNRFHLKLQDIQPGEFRFDTLDLSPLEKNILNSKTEEDIRSRLCLLKGVNSMIYSNVVSMINFDSRQGICLELSMNKDLLTTSWKFELLHSILDATVEKNDDNPTVTISLNPVENVYKETHDITSTWFYQSYKIVSEISSSNLCIAMPSSDDPQYPLLIKMSGEEVQGNSGSFRQFLNTIIQEIHGSSLPILMPYMGNGPFKGMYQLRPGPIQILTQKLLVYFGQLIGMAVRSGIPLPLGLIPHFWKCLANATITAQDLADFDPEFASYLLEIENCSNPNEFEILLENHQYPAFVYQSITGGEIELCNGGKNIGLSYDNRQKYISSLKKARHSELECKAQIEYIIIGLSTILPIRLIQGLFTWEELQMKICGPEDIELHLLKKYTIYQVGLSEEDRHIQDFWQALFSLSTKQQKMFIKFACNQERIPVPEVGDNLPPPYPMKIAPADARDELQDNLLIRAETCIFMVKIPRYSTYDVMREKLLYSIFSADDPLSG